MNLSQRCNPFDMDSVQTSGLTGRTTFMIDPIKRQAPMKFPNLIFALFLVTICTTGVVTAQSFEGVIEFTKTTGPVSTTYKYYVKDDFVRIEELSEKGVIQGIMLVDNANNSVTALSPERKLFMDVPNMRLPKEVEVKVEKTGITRELSGYNCEKWEVINTEADRKVIYWVANDGFDFFLPLLKTLNRKDEQAVYFMEIPDANGVFPMQGTESKLGGSNISTLQVQKITPSKMVDDLFRVPTGFTKFERN
jgi:hypothetical protein